MVTAGSQMAFNLAARALLRPGDVIAVEELGYRPAWAAFEAGGARLHPIPIDDEGIVVDRLHALSRRERVRAVYVTPHRQYPTTVTMPASRRLQLLEFAARHGVYVIEDDYDHEFHYTSPPVAPLASLQAEARVACRNLVEGIRTGCTARFRRPAADLVDRMIECRAVIDLHGAHVLELAIAILFEDGSMQRHMNRVRRLYAARRDLMAAAVTERLSPAVRIMPNSGGLGMWCPVDPRVDVEGLAYAARQHDVQLHTGRHYSFGQEPVPAIRLSFAPLSATRSVMASTSSGDELRRAGCA